MDLNTGLVFALSRVQGFLIWLVPSRDPGLGHVILRQQSLRGGGGEHTIWPCGPQAHLCLGLFLVKADVR